MTSLTTEQIVDTYITTFYGIDAGPMASISFDHGGPAVTGIGQRATFTMKPFQMDYLSWIPEFLPNRLDEVQEPFSVKVVRFDRGNRVLAVHTEPFHPVNGWRYFRVYQSGLSPSRVMIETGAYDTAGVDNLPAVWMMPTTPPLPTPNPLDLRNVFSFLVFRDVQLKFWEYYLEAIEAATGATQTSESLVEGNWDISDAHLKYIQKHFCGGAVPLANGDCP